MVLRKWFIVVFVVVCAGNAIAQPETNKWSISGELLLPSGRANGPFRSYLNGLVNAHPKLTYTIADHWFVSAGPKYMYYTVSEYKVPEKMNGGMHVKGGDLEFGYTRWMTKNFGMDFGMKVGFANYSFVTDTTRLYGVPQVNSMYYEPNIQFVLMADEGVAYRWIVGYNISAFDFQPTYLGLETNGGFSDADINKPSQTFLVGFGMTIYLGNKRSDTDILEVNP